MTKRGFLRTIAIAGMLAVLLGPVLAMGQGTAAVKPDAVAIKFYKWYLLEMKANHDPVSGDRKALAAYVSAPLLHEIEVRMKSPDGLDADYFIQAQDYLDDWVSSVSAKTTNMQSSTATTVVTLGGKPESLYRLSVTWVKESGDWKIRRVKRLASPATSAGAQKK